MGEKFDENRNTNAAIEKSAAALRFYVARLRNFHFPALVVATILCYFLRKIDDSDVYVALIFELTVVLVSRFTDGYLFGLLSSVVGVIGINYIFTFPYYQLNFTISGYPLTFLVMLIMCPSLSVRSRRRSSSRKKFAPRLKRRRCAAIF